jgi:hypothetical protein
MNHYMQPLELINNHQVATNMAPKELNFITGNKNKLTEVQAILGDVVHLQSQSLDLVEIQGTIEDVTTDKCRRAAELVFFQNENISSKYLTRFRSRGRYWLKTPAFALMP